MSKLPPPLHSTAQAIYEAWEKRAEDGLRAHSGCSVAGHACARFIWLDFRWAERAKFHGRVLRMFDSGKREEPRVVADLQAIGCEVSTGDGDRQWTVSFAGGHGGGSLDGAVRGLPEAPKTWHVLEVKTANDKSWNALAKDGVQKAQPRHYVQMQLYMHLTGMERALYVSVNKNTDESYIERVHYDKDFAQAALERVEKIIFSPEPPPRISEDPAWYECKLCTYHPLCHGTTAPLVNCRTCAHSTPQAEGGWRCERGNDEVHDAPKAGCAEHRYIPMLLERFAEQVDADEKHNKVTYRSKITGAEFVNGAGRNHCTSQEIRDLEDKAMLGQERVDDTVRGLRRMGGRYARNC